MGNIKWIVIHCSATNPARPYTLEMLRRDHVLHNKWTDIGYHYYITTDGVLHKCRPESIPGAHVKGFNQKSIGVCYEGGLNAWGQPEDTRTAEQIITLHNILVDLKSRYPNAVIVGHRDLLHPRTKSCPCFDAQSYYAYLS